MDTQGLGDVSIDLFEYKRKLNGMRKKVGKLVGKNFPGTKSLDFRFDEIVLFSSLLKNELGKIGVEISKRKEEEVKKQPEAKKEKYFSSDSDLSGVSTDESSEEDEESSATVFFEKQLAKMEKKKMKKEKRKNKREESSDEEVEIILEPPPPKKVFKKTESNQIRSKTILRGILIFSPEELEKVIRGNSNTANDNLIGVGSFGKVYHSWMRNRGQIEDVVIKKVQLDTSLDMKVVQSEIVILSVCQHTNIAEIIGFGISQTHAYMVMNHYDEIDIYAMKKLSLLEKIKILRDVSKGGEYLHQNNIIHRDLKWGNVMIKKGVAKILDFGISKLGGQNKTMVGTPEMVPPEIVLGEGQVEYSSKVDIFPFGIMMWILLRENPLPYGRGTDPRIMFRVANGKRPKTSGLDFGNEKLKELMIEAWHGEPVKRPDFTQVVERLEKIIEEVKKK